MIRMMITQRGEHAMCVEGAACLSNQLDPIWLLFRKSLPRGLGFLIFWTLDHTIYYLGKLLTQHWQVHCPQPSAHVPTPTPSSLVDYTTMQDDDLVMDAGLTLGYGWWDDP